MLIMSDSWMLGKFYRILFKKKGTNPSIFIFYVLIGTYKTVPWLND